MSRLLGLAYASHLDPHIIARLEGAARATGLPLRDVELLGQSEAAALEFIAAVDRGDLRTFLQGNDWDALGATMDLRREKAGFMQVAP